MAASHSVELMLGSGIPRSASTFLTANPSLHRSHQTSARGAAVDPKSGHGFVSSKPVVMFDTKTLAVVKKIDLEGGPDGISFDPDRKSVV